MRKLLIIFASVLLFSCSTTTQKKDEPWVIQDTTQRLNDYQDTLESSVQNAKKVRDQYNQNWKDLEQSITNSKAN